MKRRKKVLSVVASALIFSIAGAGQAQAEDISVSVSPSNPFTDFSVVSNGQSYQVDIFSNGGDPVIQLYSGDAGSYNTAYAANPSNHVNEDDDGGSGLDSLITGTATAGSYTLRVSSFAYWVSAESETRTYTLRYTGFNGYSRSGNALRVDSAGTATEKNNLIQSIIKPKKILTVATEIVDPEYLYLLVDVTTKYDSDKTSASIASLKSIITDIISTYNTDEINQFSKYFRYSKLSRLIDVSERSILNSILTLRMRKEVDIQLNTPTKYTIGFSNGIDTTTSGRPSSHPYGVGNKVTSNAFSYQGFDNCFLEENNGIMRIYRATTTENLAVQINAGTLNYVTGEIVLNSFAPTSFADGGNTLKLTAYPAEKDILPLRNQILSIRDEDISVTMVDDKSISLVNR